MTSLGGVFSANWIRARDETDPGELAPKAIDAAFEESRVDGRDVEILKTRTNQK